MRNRSDHSVGGNFRTAVTRKARLSQNARRTKHYAATKRQQKVQQKRAKVSFFTFGGTRLTIIHSQTQRTLAVGPLKQSN